MRLTASLLLLLSAACGESAESATEPARPAPAAEAPARVGASPVPEGWVTARREDAESRLQSSEAGQQVWNAIEAHGGLRAWLQPGTIEFEFDYAPIGRPEGRKHTFQRVDLWSARAHHREIGGDVEFGFDGETSWMKPNADAFSPSARFWALTPYYFVGIPFVLADPGVVLTSLEDAELNGEPYDVVKATYESGTGDSPDDYYIVYLDKGSHRVAALRYVVSFPGMFAPGEHSPEKIMLYSEPVEVGGLRLASEYHTHRWNAEEGIPGERVTDINASRFALGESYEDSVFEAPEGAVIEPAPN